MLLRGACDGSRLGSCCRSGLGASIVFSPPTGSVSSLLQQHTIPLTQPRPIFTAGPTIIDYAPAPPIPPTVASSVSAAMQPMGGAYDSSGNANVGGSSSSSSPPIFASSPPRPPLYTGTAPLPDLPAPASSGAGQSYAALPLPGMVAPAPPGLVHLLNPFDPQRNPVLIAGVLGGAGLALGLLLRRR